MSHTGHYVAVNGRWVKVSDEHGFQSAVGRKSCWFPSNGTKYFDKQANRTFHSKNEKRAWMRDKGLVETEPTWRNPLKGLAESGKRTPMVMV